MSDDITRSLFGDFGVWLIGVCGVGFTSCLVFVAQRVIRIVETLPSIHEKQRELDRKLCETEQDVNSLTAKIDGLNDDTKQRFDDVTLRIDHVNNQTLQSHLGISTQISSMQQMIATALANKREDD